MNSLRCSNCAFLNFATATACKRCGLPFDTHTESNWNPQPYAPNETCPQPNEGGSFFWDQPQSPYQPNYFPPAPSAPARSGKPRIARILIGFAILAVLCGLALPILLKKGKTDYASLSWREHKSTTKNFSISLPAAPKVTRRTVPSPFGNADAEAVEAAVGREGGCLVLVADYPNVNSKLTEDAIYDMAIQGATRTQRAVGFGQRKNITLSGYRGVEVQLLSNEPSTPFVGSLRVFWVSPRMYVVATGGPDTTEFRAVSTRCLDSFRIATGN